MNDILPILLVIVCAAVVLLGGVLALGAFGFLRAWAPKLLEIMGGAGAVFRSESHYDPLTELSQRRRPNLREKAKSLDFDAALAEHRHDPNHPTAFNAPPSTPESAAYQPPVGNPFESETAPFDEPIAPRLRRKRRDRNQDEIFGGMLDEDGDGDIDF